MIQDTGSVKDLPTRVFVVSVTYKQILGSESIRLDVYICLCDVVDETGFTDVGETSHDEGAGVSVDLGKARQMFSDLFQVTQTGFQLFQEGSSATKSGALQHLGTVETVGVF